jgi:NitT/TauT family transport system ATP-binding protein
MATLQAHQLGMTYRTRRGPLEALRQVDLTVPAGEFVAVVGPSGSGKSTFVRLVGGLERPTRGRIAVDGRPVQGPGRERAFVFQEDRLFPWRTALDNVAFGLEARGTPRRRARETAARYVALVGLAGFGGAYPHELSGGMRQRVNLARALAVDPALLLLDEPFAALDAQTREVLQAELLRLWGRQQKTVLFVTHQIDEAVYLADRVVVFTARPGRVREVIPIALPRPRPLSVKRTAGFQAYVDRLWHLIQHDARPHLDPPPDPDPEPEPEQAKGTSDVCPAYAA